MTSLRSKTADARPLSLLEAREAGTTAAGQLEECRRVFRRDDEWVAVIATSKVALRHQWADGPGGPIHEMRGVRVVRHEVVGRAR